MKKIIRYAQSFLLCSMLFLYACSDDEGNYTYSDKQVIEITGVPFETSLLSGAEYIDIKPTITSSIDGEIEEGNPDYTFQYQQKNSSGDWVDVTSEKNLYQLARLGSGKHAFRFIVTENETGIKAFKLFYIHATTATSEGWIVLCNEGPEEKVRVDMLSQLGLERIFPSFDVLLVDDDVPPINHAVGLGFSSNQSSDGNRIVMMAETGAYLIPTADTRGYSEFVTLKEGYHEFKNSEFLLPPRNEHIVCYTPVPANLDWGKRDHAAVICVSREGNAYARVTSGQLAAFEYPINTSRRWGDPEYRVAPYVGATLKRPVTPATGTALLYDTDNHQFIGWSGTDDNSKQSCYPLKDPAIAKFSFNTGGMDLVCMINSAYSGGDVFCIMQDGNKRHLYVINVSTDDFAQSGAYLDISAPHFDKATLFAVSSQYPVLYYAYKNIVYAYDYTTGETTEAITLDTTEEVTMIKFNRVDHPKGITQGLLLGKDPDGILTPEFQARENRLIVGSYDSTVADDNGGILRFYDVATPGNKLTLHQDGYRAWEYKGYAKIKDVIYKEIR